MILTRKKATKLLEALEKYCKEKKIFISKNKSIRLIKLSKIIIDRYKSVVLVQGKTKFICNDAKYLKKWALHESIRKMQPLVYNIGYMTNL